MARLIEKIKENGLLLSKLIKINLYLRYHGTFFGFFWTFLNAIAMLIIFTFVFSYILKINIPRFPVFLFCAYIPWLFFSSSMINSCHIFLKNHSLLQKVYFPRELLIIAEIISHLLIFLASFTIFLIFFTISFKLDFTLSISNILIIPLIIFIQFLLSLSMGFFLSIANVYFRDISYFIEILITIWFYLTPIFYPLKWVPENVKKLVLLNPITSVIKCYRDIFYISKNMTSFQILYPLIISITLFLISWNFFRKYEKTIVEEI